MKNARQTEILNIIQTTAVETQEQLLAEYDAKIEAAAADYQELTLLLSEKEEAETVLLNLMEQWEAVQE